MLDNATQPPFFPEDIARMDRLLLQLAPFNLKPLAPRSPTWFHSYQRLCRMAREVPIEASCRKAKKWLDKKQYLVTRRALVKRTGHSRNEIDRLFRLNPALARELEVKRPPQKGIDYVPRKA